MDSPKPSTSTVTRSTTLTRRLGWQAVCTLTATTLAALAVIGFLGFLWFADLRNGFWHQIMISGWATRAVSISTLVLRSAIDLQAGVAAAMLAALVLESSTVRLRDAAQLSTMRAGSPQPRALLEIIPAMSGLDRAFFRLDFVGYSTTILLLFATTTVLQFSSTILLSDLQLGQLPSLVANRSASYDFVYDAHGHPFTNANTANLTFGYSQYTGPVTYPLQLRIPTWSRNPPAFPAFAEYSRPISSPEGVDDTGVLLRAFLPFADAQSRESIRNYSGVAHVLDSRVSCQAPHLQNVSMKLANWYYPGAGISDPVGARLRGVLEPSVTAVDRLWTPGPVPFDCETFANVDSVSICQVHFSGSSRFYQDSGSLLSEFWNITHNDTRTAVLQGGLALYSLPLLVVQSHKSSTDNLNQNITGIKRQGSQASISTPSSSWTISICYSAWATANLNVDMFSEINRSEPITHWNRSQGYYTLPDVHKQLGETDEQSDSIMSRGILQLAEKASWIPDAENSIPNSVKPFVQEFADLNEDASLEHMLPYQCSPCSALLAPWNSRLTYGFDKNSMFLVDYTLSDLFHQSIGGAGNGSWARAVSSLITTLSSMAYYDQMPQFQKTSKTSQVFFTTVLFPQSHFGFWLISIALAAHITQVTLIAIGFMMYSQHTMLGNHWQTIAQLQGPETEDLLTRTRMATDSDVKRALRIAGYESVRIGVRSLNDERSVGLSAVKHRDRTTESEEYQ